MKRADLAKLLREASRITRQRDFLVIGSAAILGSFDDVLLPERATLSAEADVVVRGDSIGDLTDQLEESGWGSPFHQTNGVYLDPVGTETAVLPPGWENRLVPFAAGGGTTGYCLDAYDLCSAKLARYDAKDREFVLALVHAGLIDLRSLRGRFTSVRDARLTPEKRRLIDQELRRFVSSAPATGGASGVIC